MIPSLEMTASAQYEAGLTTTCIDRRNSTGWDLAFEIPLTQDMDRAGVKVILMSLVNLVPCHLLCSRFSLRS